MNEVKKRKNIPIVENSPCKAPEAGKSMARVTAVQRARGTT